MSIARPIPRQTRQIIVTATAGQTSFGPSDFPLFDPDDVNIRIKLSGGSSWTLLDKSAYTVHIAPPATAWPALFSVVLANACSAGDQVWIKGTRIPSRLTNVTRAGKIQSQLLEGEFDVQAATEQELRRDIDAMIAGGAEHDLIASGVANDGPSPGGTVADALGLLDGRLDETETGLAEITERVDEIQGAVASYASVAAVQAAIIPEGASYVRTAGYFSAGDLGGALYRKVIAEPSHAGKIRSADGAWWELAEQIWNVCMFGAASSSLDNADALQSAVDALPSTGGTIIIPNKPFLTSRGILLAGSAANKSNVTLQGQGRYSEIKLAAGAGNENNVIDILGGVRHAVLDVTVTGDKGNGGAPVRGPNRGMWAAGMVFSINDRVEVSGADAATTIVAPGNLVYRCIADHTASATFLADKATKWVLVSEPNFNTVDISYRYRNGIYIDGAADVEVSGCFIRSCVYAGINIGTGPVQTANAGPGATDITISNNRIADNESGIAGGKWTDVIIAGNKIKDNTVYGIVPDISSVSVELCHNILVSAAAAIAAIFLYGAHDVTVAGNLIRGWTNGIVVDGAAARAIVSNNQIRACSNVGVFARATSYSAITGNTIIGCGSHGIDIEQSVSIPINDNIIDGNGGAGILSNASELTSAVGNTVTRNAGGGIIFTACGGGVIGSNKCLNNTGPAIHGVDTVNVALSGNRCYDNRGGGSKTQTYGALTSGASAGWVVGVNHFGGNLTADAVFSGANSNAAMLESPAFTGSPTAPTAPLGTSTEQIATMQAIQNALDALLGGAPGVLDTLKELADAINDDASFAATVTSALAGKQPADATLTAIAGLDAAAGMVVETAADVFLKRTLAGTVGEIDIANDDGAAGNPTVSLAANVKGAWTAFTPVISANTGTFTAVSATGRYRQVGKTVEFGMKITITTNGSAAGYIVASLPVAARASNNCSCVGYEEAAGYFPFFAHNFSTTQMLLINLTGTYPGADGYVLNLNGQYEAA